jgi:VTC domain
VAEDLVAEFEPVSLSELDERASPLRRVDNKYAVEREQFARLLERLREHHQVLEIDGRRMFRYRSTYFDTPDLRCYVDHVEDRQPRFKARTRLYVDSENCVFEVKLKGEDGAVDLRPERATDRPDRPDRPRDGASASLREGVVLVETKSEEGESPADAVLAELGLEPISLSKYRVGMSLVGGANSGPQPGSDLFSR